MNNPMNILNMLPQLKQNPMALLQRVGLNIPANVTNPQQMIQHLMNSGQITQQQYDNACQIAKQFGLK